MVNAGIGSMAAVIGFDRNQLDLLVRKIINSIFIIFFSF